MERRHWELRKLKEAIEKELAWKPVGASALGKVKKYLQGMEKPKPETLDKLALLVGFQDWESFREALQGDTDAAANYDVELPQKASSTTGSAPNATPNADGEQGQTQDGTQQNI